MTRRLKTALFASAALLALAAAIVWLLFRPAPKTDISVLVPQSAIGFLEIDDVPKLIDGFTHTRAWSALAPQFGLPDQLKLLGSAGSLLSSTGLGPDEAVALARSQILVVVTAIEVDGDVVQPKFTLIFETHANPDSVDRLRKHWVPLLSERLYKSKIREETFQHGGVICSHYSPADQGAGVFSANAASAIYVSNDRDSLALCLDTRGDVNSSVKNDPAFERSARALFSNADVAGYISRNGMARVAKLAAFLFAGRFGTSSGYLNDVEPTLHDAVSSLFDGAACSMSYADGVARERRLLLLRPGVQSRLKDILRPSARPMFLPGQIPSDASAVTFVNVQDSGKAIEDLQALLSFKSSVVTAALMRQATIEMRRHYGLRTTDNLSQALGDEFAWITLRPSGDALFCASIRSSQALDSLIPGYLSARGLKLDPALRREDSRLYISNTNSGEALLATSKYLLMGNKQAILNFEEARDRGLRLALENHQSSFMQSREDESQQAAQTLIEIAKILRTSDGDPSALQKPALLAALSGIEPATSYLSYQSGGIEQTRSSPLGWLPTLFSLLEHD